MIIRKWNFTLFLGSKMNFQFLTYFIVENCPPKSLSVLQYRYLKHKKLVLQMFFQHVFNKFQMLKILIMLGSIRYCSIWTTVSNFDYNTHTMTKFCLDGSSNWSSHFSSNLANLMYKTLPYLNNYFNFHVCLSFRLRPSSVLLLRPPSSSSVRPKTNFNSCRCITKFH